MSSISNNPFQGSSYLMRYQGQVQPRPSTAEDASNPDPTKDITRYGYGSEYEAFLANHMQQTKQDQSKKKEKTGEPKQGETLQEKMLKLSQQQEEVSRLQKQLQGALDPTQKKQIEASFNQKSLGVQDLRNDVSLRFRGPGSGFVGSENRVDHVGSFVTSA